MTKSGTAVLYLWHNWFKMSHTLARNIYSFILLCLVLVAGPVVFGQESAVDLAETASMMRSWHVAEGLPSDSVTAIAQTRDGFLWIGTSAGVVRFDGVQFSPLAAANSSTNPLTGVTSLCEDSNGRLWIGTQRNGLFELAHGDLIRFSTADGLLDNNITSLAADARGQVWAGCNSGLNLWDGQRFRSFTTRDGLPDDVVSGVNVARSGTVWITTRVGMCRFVGGRIAPYLFQTDSQGRSPEYLGAYEDRRGNLWAFGDTYLINLAEGKRFNYFRSSEPGSVRIWSLCEGRDGRLWIGTSGRGLFCFEENRFQPIVFGEDRWPYDVRAICEDREGNLWLGTSGGGLTQLRLQSVHVLRGGQGLPERVPTALAMDGEGSIYVGLEREGLWRGQSGRFDRLNGSDLFNFISSLCVGRDATVWAGTMGNGLFGWQGDHSIHITTADGLGSDVVLAMCADPEAGIWASTRAGTLHHLTDSLKERFDSRQGLPAAPVTTMIAAAGGGLWLGTQDGKIVREKDGKFDVAFNAGSGPVLSMFEGEDKRLWIGSAGGGLGCIRNGSVLNWNTNKGVPNSIVSSVVEDHAKNLWLAMPLGIYRVSRSDVAAALDNPRLQLACRFISPAKSLPDASVTCGGPRAVLAKEGYLWFATADGILNVDTRQQEVEASSFPVYAETAIINAQRTVSLLNSDLSSPVRTNAPFVAPVDVRSLEFRFTALNFSTPEDVQFRHKLDGFDSDWVEDGGARFARYGRLPPGNYRFHVAARISDGLWQDARQGFAFYIPTPLYFQTWAIILYGICAIALIAGTVRVISHRRLRQALARLEQQQTLERERMRIARDMHDEMGSKLTKISFLCERVQLGADPGAPEAEKIQAIAQSSRDLLKTMDEIVWVVNPRNDTLENLTTYLSHYAIEYFQNTQVDCELRLPQDIPQHPLSSETRHNLFLAFEETLNNVLKHSHATKAKIEINAAESFFEIKVSDNGHGFDQSAVQPNGHAQGQRGGNGLKNMHQRLVAIGGECTVSSRPGAGTTVTMHLHLNENSAN